MTANREDVRGLRPVDNPRGPWGRLRGNGHPVLFQPVPPPASTARSPGPRRGRKPAAARPRSSGEHVEIRRRDRGSVGCAVLTYEKHVRYKMRSLAPVCGAATIETSSARSIAVTVALLSVAADSGGASRDGSSFAAAGTANGSWTDRGARCRTDAERLAEGEGFEPPVPFRVQRFSRPPVSTTHTSLRAVFPKDNRANNLRTRLRRPDCPCRMSEPAHFAASGILREPKGNAAVLETAASCRSRCGWSRQASAARGPRGDLRQFRPQTPGEPGWQRPAAITENEVGDSFPALSPDGTGSSSDRTVCARRPEPRSHG